MSNENLGELFAALALARQEFGIFTKSKTAMIKSDKGSYGYSYADLSDIIEATATALAKHGLVIIQEPEVVGDGGRQMVIISGCIAHKSGGVYQLRPLSMPIAGGTAQAIGSAVSYARRYQLSAVLNLAASADDDDGQAAQDATSATKPQKRQESPNAQHRGNEATKAQSTPQRASVQATSDNPFEGPSDEELEILGVWKTPDDAKAWAIENKSCANEHEARESFKKIVDANGGKLTKENIAVVYLLFLRRQNEKLAQPAHA